MKIIIAKNGVKRELLGSFEICGDYTDLVWVANQIFAAAVREDVVTYGWVSIPERPPSHGAPDTAPLKWENQVPADREL